MRFRQRFTAFVLVVGAGSLVGVVSADAQTLDCSTPLTHSLTLTENAKCADPLGGTLVIGADHITINLNGHSILSGFANVIASNGHRFVTIENGFLQTQSIVMPLNNVDHFTIRNMGVEGDFGGIVLTGGSHNEIIDSFTIARFPEAELQLTGEQGDVVRGNTTYHNCQIKLDYSSGNRIVGNAAGELDLNHSDQNIVMGNTVGATCVYPYKPYSGITGTGNRNLIFHNVFRGADALTGVGNVLFDNTFQP